MSDSQSNKPVAVKVLRSWNYKNLSKPLPIAFSPYLSVNEGQLGWVFQVSQDKQFAFLHAFDDSVKRGWVPTSILQRGVEKADPLPIELPAGRQFPPHNPQMASNLGDNCLSRTLRSFWSRIVESRTLIEQTFPTLTAKARRVLLHPNAGQYADHIYRCMIPEARSFMEDGQFNLMGLQNLLSAVSANYPINQTGLYTILYDQFGNRSFGTRSYDKAQYWGQTIHFQNRDIEHRSNSTGNNNASNHYRVAFRAAWRMMIPILFVSGSVPPDFLDAAEFTLVAIMTAWTPVLFKPNDANLLGAFSIDFRAAIFFRDLMNQVRNETGWNPVQLLGLNWDTPLIRGDYECQPWTSWYSHEFDMVLYRSRRPILININNKEIGVTWGTSVKIGIPDNIQQQAKFTNGQVVHIVAELAINQRGGIRPHPYRWIRFPHIGRNPELEKLECMAIRLEWQVPNSDQWCSAYLERTILWQQDPNHDVPLIYRTGLAMWMDLQELEFTGKPAWALPRLAAPVQYMHYDHLQQKLVTRIVRVTTKPWPNDYTIQQNGPRLRATFPKPQFNDLSIGVRPPGVASLRRRACDLCLSQRTTTRCTFDDGPPACKCCRALRRPCTFTNMPRDALVQDMVQGRTRAELGIAVNLVRNEGGQAQVLPRPPFNPNLEEMV